MRRNLPGEEDRDGDLFALLAATSLWTEPAPTPEVAAPPPAPYDVAVATVETPVGFLTLAMSDRGLAVCSYDNEEDVVERLSRGFDAVGGYDRRLDPVRHELDAYFESRLRAFSIRLDLRLISDFGKVVLRSLTDVGYGTTITYRQLAERIGKVNAPRAIGNTLTTNPLCILLPCHRVVADTFPEDPGGYAGGAATKRFLLTLEGSLRRRPSTTR